MALHQYIGARYVPQFYENSLGTAEWQSGVIYEPLTIVTYNNNSYTSKKTVPANIGDPSANPDYWVATGMFNAQLSALTTRVNAIENNVGDIDKKVQWFVPEMFGAVGDGVTDDCDAIQDMFDAVPDESVIMFPADKYYTSQQIVIRGNNLCVRGKLAISEASPQIRSDLANAPIILVQGSGNFFYDIDIFNSSGTVTDHYGIMFDADNADANGNVDAQLNHVIFFKFAVAVRCRGRNLKVSECIFSTCSEGVKLEQTTIDTELRGYDISNNRVHSTQTFVNNEITNVRTPKNIKISNNFMDFGSTLFVGYGGGVVISNNFLDAKGAGGTLLKMVGDALNGDDYVNRVNGNTFYGGSTTTNGLLFESACKAIIDGNLITGVPYNGINLSDTCFGIVRNNVIENCGQNSGSYSIVASATATGLIAGNVMYNTTRYVGGATIMTVQDNYQM